MAKWKTIINATVSSEEGKIYFADSEKELKDIKDKMSAWDNIPLEWSKKISELKNANNTLSTEIVNLVKNIEENFDEYWKSKIKSFLFYHMVNKEREVINKWLECKDSNQVSPLTYTHCTRLRQNLFLQYSVDFNHDWKSDHEDKKTNDAIKKIIDTAWRTSDIKTKIENYWKEQIVMWEIYSRVWAKKIWEEFYGNVDIIPMMCITYKKWKTPDTSPYVIWSTYEDIDYIISRRGSDIMAQNSLNDLEKTEEFVRYLSLWTDNRWPDRSKYDETPFSDYIKLNQKRDEISIDDTTFYNPETASPYSIYVQELYMKETIVLLINGIVVFKIKNKLSEKSDRQIRHPFCRWMFNGNKYDKFCKSLPEILKVPQSISDIVHNAVVDSIPRSLNPMRKTTSSTMIDWYEDWYLKYEPGKLVTVDWELDILDIEMKNENRLFNLMNMNNEYAWNISWVTKYSWGAWQWWIERSATWADRVAQTTEGVWKPIVSNINQKLIKSSKIFLIEYMNLFWNKIKMGEEEITLKYTNFSDWNFEFVSDWILSIERDKELRRMLEIVVATKDLILSNDRKWKPMVDTRLMLQELFHLAWAKWVVLTEKEAEELSKKLFNNTWFDNWSNEFVDRNNWNQFDNRWENSTNDIVTWAWIEGWEAFEDNAEEIDLSLL